VRAAAGCNVQRARVRPPGRLHSAYLALPPAAGSTSVLSRQIGRV
jgi:hypothetical protein